jgi:trimeric autotransporter adhesin
VNGIFLPTAPNVLYDQFGRGSTMDAAYTTLKKTAFFLALALLIPAAASAQPAFVLNGGNNATSITLVGNSAAPVSVASSMDPTTEITFNAATTYTTAGDLPWLCIANTFVGCDSTAASTPTTLNVIVGQNAGALSIGTHTATITLTGAGASAGINGTIYVTYTTNSFQTGGGTGTLTASPSAPSISAAYGAATTLSFELSTTSASAVSFNLTQPSVTWASNFVCSGLVSGSVSSSAPATCSVNLNGAGQAQTTLSTTLAISYATGTLSVTIYFGNGVSVGGSSGGTGTLSLSTNPVLLSYTYGTTTFPSASVSLSSTSGAISYSFSTTSSANWLLINGQTQGSGLTLPATLNITTDSNLATLAAGGTYNGYMNITGSDGSTIQLTVTVTVSGTNTSGLTILPNPITINAALNGVNEPQIVTITSTTGGQVSVGISGTGLSVSAPVSSSIIAGGSTTVTVTGSPAGLSAQTYVGQLSVNVGGIQQSDQINFQVGSTSVGGGSTSIAAAPTAMSFTYEINSQMESTQTQQAYLSGSGSYTATVSVSNGVNWLSVSNQSGTLPLQYFYVYANANSLAAGTYIGSVTLTNTSNGQTSTISVTLLVTGTTAIYTIPGDLVFAYIAGTTSANQSQALSISSSDGSLVTVSAAVSNPGSTPWLTLTSGSVNVTGSAVSTIAVNANNLANGVYTGAITINGVGVVDSPLNVPVVLSVVGSSVSTGSGSLTLGSSALTLSAQVNGAAVSTTLGVTAATNTTYTVTSQGSYNGITWLSVSPSGTLTTSGNPNLTVTADPYNFPAGNYSGSISLTANGVTQSVQVTMVVGGAIGTSGNVTVTANGGTSTSPTLSFSSSAPGAVVTPQYLSVASAAGASGVGFQATTSTTNGVNWILVGTPTTAYSTSASGTTPATLNVAVSTSALTTGTYNGSVIITATGGNVVTVPVTLTLGAATIGVSSTTLSFSYAAGGVLPNSQNVSVTVSNATSGNFTAVASSTGGWLSVTPASGTAPGTVNVSVAATGLSAGTYSGSITVAGASGSTGSATINVTLTVTVPLPTVTAVVNAASFVNEAISPGEIITIGGTNIGPATPASLTLDPTGKFVTTTLSGVQVQINGYSAPLLYVSSSQINAVVPYEIAGILNPTLLVKTNVTTSTGGQTSNGFPLTAASTASGIFTQNGSGTGPGAILNSNLSVNTAANPAPRGTTIVVYMTGEGQTSPQGVDGKVTTAPYPAPLLPVAVTIGGAAATVSFMGEAPGLVSGVLQLNVMVPPASILTTTGAVPIVVTFGGGTSSQAGVTVNVQ